MLGSKQFITRGSGRGGFVGCAIQSGVEAAGLADGVCVRTSQSEGKRKIQDDCEDRRLSKRRDRDTVFCDRRARERPLHVWECQGREFFGGLLSLRCLV